MRGNLGAAERGSDGIGGSPLDDSRSIPMPVSNGNFASDSTMTDPVDPAAASRQDDRGTGP